MESLFIQLSGYLEISISKKLTGFVVEGHIYYAIQFFTSISTGSNALKQLHIISPKPFLF